MISKVSSKNEAPLLRGFCSLLMLIKETNKQSLNEPVGGPPYLVSCTSCRTGTGARGEPSTSADLLVDGDGPCPLTTPRLPAGSLAPLSASGVRLSISVCPSNLFLRCIHVQCPPHRWWGPGGTGGSSRIRSEIPASQVLMQGMMYLGLWW